VRIVVSEERGRLEDVDKYQDTYLPHGQAYQFAASQEIPHILWNLKVHYHINKCLPPVPILNQINPFRAPPTPFLKIHLNIILSSVPGFSKWSLSLRFPHQNRVYTFPVPPIHATCPANLIFLDGHLNNIW